MGGREDYARTYCGIVHHSLSCPIRDSRIAAILEDAIGLSHKWHHRRVSVMKYSKG